MVYKETFSNRGTNASALNAGVELAIEDQKNAERHGNIPHNAFVITNQDDTCTVYIFLDDFSDEEKPDFVLFPNQTIAVSIEDGVSFTTIWLKNTHASSNIDANKIKYNIMTVKDLPKSRW
jgi:hypothetical protein